MTNFTRREALQTLAATLPAFTWTRFDVERAAEFAQGARRAGNGHEPKFFTDHEWRTVRMLVDIVIPRDERSGSASDAGVPEFMDFIMLDSPGSQTPMRGGLAWLDAECRHRYNRNFVDCSDGERNRVLDHIAFPDRSAQEYSHGVAFFNRFRDLTASGFWSSKMGVEDLRYMGNTFVPQWTGCPEPQLRRLGVSYED